MQPMPGGSENCHLFLFNAMSSLHEQWPWLDIVCVPCHFLHHHTFPACAYIPMSQYYFWTNEFLHIWMSVSIVSFLNTQPGVVTLLASTSPFTIILWVFFTVSGIWNLDFFCYLIPPFCVSDQINPLHVITLEYVVAFYPLLLTVIVYICVQLHARGCWVIVCLCRVFSVSVSAAVNKVGLDSGIHLLHLFIHLPHFYSSPIPRS